MYVSIKCLCMSISLFVQTRDEIVTNHWLPISTVSTNFKTDECVLFAKCTNDSCATTLFLT